MPQERCIYCLYDKVPYDAGQSTVRCPACGNLLYIADFKGEKLKLDLARKERDQAKQALEEAQKEKRQAEERLFAALDRLESIDAAQGEQKDALSGLMSGLAFTKENQRDMETLLHGLAEGQQAAGGQRDVIAALLRETMKSQATAEQKLQLLQMLCGKIVNAQGSILTQLGLLTDVSETLKSMDMRLSQREQLIMDFTRWFQDTHEEDIGRLNQIRDASGRLLSAQQAADEKIVSLMAASERKEAELKQFYGQWQASEQSKMEEAYRQATDDLLDKKFQEAEQKFKQVLVAGERSVDIYWRLILCHYGVEYQFSEAEGRYVPTFYYPDIAHSPEEMTIWKNFERKIEEAGNKEEYRERAEELKEILEAYRYIHLEEDKPYDVFISVKQSDAQGHYTPDSDKGSDLYDALTGWGYKVFNSRRCMDRHAGIKYEPYILAALMSARVMIVVGTNRDNMEARWVKNEWQRFQWLEQNERKLNPSAPSRLLLCYIAGNMRPRDIPAGLNPDRQAIREGFTTESTLKAILNSVFGSQAEELRQAQDAVPQAEEARQAQEPVPQAEEASIEEEAAEREEDMPTAAEDEDEGIAAPIPPPVEESPPVQDPPKRKAKLRVRYQERAGKLLHSETILVDYPGSVTVNARKFRKYELVDRDAKTIPIKDPNLSEYTETTFYYAKKKSSALKVFLALAAGFAALYYIIVSVNWTFPSDSQSQYHINDSNSQSQYHINDSNSQFQYHINDQGYVTIDHYSGSYTEVVIPDTLSGHAVKEIGEAAFSNCRNVTSVTIPSSVTTIGKQAFKECSRLKSVTILGGVTSIGDQAFSKCSSLASVTMPISVASIGSYAFYNCERLKSVVIPSSVTILEKSVFSNCRNLKDVSIPYSVTRIEDSAFHGCASLTGLTIPNSVTCIGSYAFYNCASLTDITIPSGIKRLENSVFSNCSSLRNISIPDSVTSIGGWAFYSCRSLTSVTVPNSVITIESYAFSGCSSLTSVTIPGSVTGIGKNAFDDCHPSIVFSVPSGSYARTYCKENNYKTKTIK